jgi:DNA replication and repair protein RecF
MAGRSFRATHLQELARVESEGFRVELVFEKSGVAQKLKMAWQADERRLQYNSTQLSSLTSLLGILQGVLLAPNDIELIQGAPHARRHYLDLQLAQVDPLYVHHLTRLSKSIKQRNWLLRSRKINAIEAYEEVISYSAAYIIQERMRLVHELEPFFQNLYQSISGQSESLSLTYHSALAHMSVDKIRLKLAEQRAKEMEVGHTQLGPHRDDLKILIQKKEARQFASEGEKRSLAASLRLAEWQRMCQVTQEPPLLLVDDFGISLDRKRLKNLGQIFNSLGQVLLTCTHEPGFNFNFNLIKLL